MSRTFWLLGVAAIALGGVAVLHARARRTREPTADAGTWCSPAWRPISQHAAEWIEHPHAGKTLALETPSRRCLGAGRPRRLSGASRPSCASLLTGLTELRLTEQRTATRPSSRASAWRTRTRKTANIDPAAGAGCQGAADRRADRRPSAGAHRGQSAREHLCPPPGREPDLARRGQAAMWTPTRRLWLDRDIMDIPARPHRLGQHRQRRARSSKLAARRRDKLTCRTRPIIRSWMTSIVDDVQRALSTASPWRTCGPHKDAPDGRCAGYRRVRATNDGLAIDRDTHEGWQRFVGALCRRGTGDKASAEATKLNARLGRLDL